MQPAVVHSAPSRASPQVAASLQKEGLGPGGGLRLQSKHSRSAIVSVRRVVVLAGSGGSPSVDMWELWAEPPASTAARL